MKKLLLLSAVAVLGLAGCASDDHYYSHRGYYYEDRPGVVVVEPDRDRAYVRERDARHWDRDDHWDHTYRGKHPDALGWNDPSWYHH